MGSGRDVITLITILENRWIGFLKTNYKVVKKLDISTVHMKLGSL